MFWVLAGCVAMRTLHVAESPATTPVRCTTDPARDLPLCTEQQRAWDQTWREVPGVDGDRVRVVLVGDAGKHLGATPDPGALAVAASAKAVCHGTCDGVVFLGDDVYPTGVDEGVAGEVQRRFLEALVVAYGVPRAWFVLGNHDWGPSWLLGARASRDRAQRLLELVRRDDGADDRFRGDAHFWTTDLGPERVAALDTNWLVRRCHGDAVRCAGDGEGLPLRDAMERMTDGADLVLGHHPWRSAGPHGSAGHYRDAGPLSLGHGRALASLYEDLDARLLVTGHDHATQAWSEGGHLAVVVGAGAEVKPPRAHPDTTLVFEDWCRLGFAVLDAGPEGRALQLYTLEPPDTREGSEQRRGCRDVLDRRRPETTLLPGEHAPDTLPGTDLRCTRFADTGRDWVREPCVVFRAPPPG